jgi:hypothetical protein
LLEAARLEAFCSKFDGGEDRLKLKRGIGAKSSDVTCLFHLSVLFLGKLQIFPFVFLSHVLRHHNAGKSRQRESTTIYYGTLINAVLEALLGAVSTAPHDLFHIFCIADP